MGVKAVLAASPYEIKEEKEETKVGLGTFSQLPAFPAPLVPPDSLIFPNVLSTFSRLYPLGFCRDRGRGNFCAHGSRFVERMFTVVSTLRKQKRNVLEYLTQSCERAISGRKPLSLLPACAHKIVA